MLFSAVGLAGFCSMLTSNVNILVVTPCWTGKKQRLVGCGWLQSSQDTGKLVDVHSGLIECDCTTNMNPDFRNQMWILNLGAITPMSEEWPLNCGILQLKTCYGSSKIYDNKT